MPYKIKNGKQEKNRNKIRWKKARLEVIEKLGGKCIRCGNDDIRVLQIDHINGGGSRERLAIGYKGNYSTMKEIMSGKIDKYQLLCANCNWIKRYENNENRKN